jgi:hypothetical protein
MSAKSVCDVISYSQGHEFLLALEKAGLTSEIAQEVISSRDNRKAEAMLAALSDEQADDRFKLVLVVSFDVIVPENYDHATRLDTFREVHEEEFYSYNDNIMDANFSEATVKLEPGRKLTVKVFQITEQVTSEKCLAFLKSQKAVLTGAQGASLVYEQAKNKLPKGKWHVSFDKKDVLWQDSDDYRRVPVVHASSGGGFDFLLGRFESNWGPAHCLLCLCDPPAGGAGEN